MIDLLPQKHKSMVSDVDDKEPQNEPGTSSTSQLFLPAPTLMTKIVSIAMSIVHEVRTLEGQCFTQILKNPYY